MNFQDYQALAGLTAGDHGDTVRELTNWAMGLAGETGELVDLLKKEIFMGQIATRKDFESEAGDVLWYLANLCRVRGVDLQRVAENNLEKLRRRYPDGFVKGGGVRD